MVLKSFYQKIDELVAKNEIGQALIWLKDFFSANVEKLDSEMVWLEEILIALSVHNRLNSEERIGGTDYREINVQRNKLMHSILQIKKDSQNLLNSKKIAVPSEILKELALPLPTTIWVKGGIFRMGSLKGMIDEQPIHLVKVNDSSIGKYPITNLEYCFFLNSNQSQKTDTWLLINQDRSLTSNESKITYNGKNYVVSPGYEEHPVTLVSWIGAKQYCNWLTEITGDKYRLPSEAEWEFAARGGNESSNYIFAGNDHLDDVGWFAANSDGDTRKIGLKSPNELGLHDMSGNLWEWCEDWYSEYYYGECKMNGITVSPTGAKQGSFRVLRGGAWNSDYTDCTVASRGAHSPSIFTDHYGFRVVKE